jgi:sulfate permease, SulP family
LSADGSSRKYAVAGQLFFVSTFDFVNGFDFAEALERVVIDLMRAHPWDGSAVGALDEVVLKFRRMGVHAEVIGLNEASATLIDRIAVHDKPEALERYSNLCILCESTLGGAKRASCQRHQPVLGALRR